MNADVMTVILAVIAATGASIVSIVEPDETKRTNPEADTVLNEGATLIVAGDRRGINSLKRLLVEGTDALEVTVLKRRGPPLLQPLVLRPHPPLLSALLAARGTRRSPQPQAGHGSHVLDRAATLAG